LIPCHANQRLNKKKKKVKGLLCISPGFGQGLPFTKGYLYVLVEIVKEQINNIDDLACLKSNEISSPLIKMPLGVLANQIPFLFLVISPYFIFIILNY
jgi:hypothetical protein